MSTNSTTQTTTPEPTTSNWAETNPEELLPNPGNGWDQVSKSGAAYSNLGYKEGAQARYKDNDGLRVRVLIVVPFHQSPRSQADEFADKGWQVALAFRKFAIAASTGTEELHSPTPETPISMETTPIPDTEDEVRTLLARSPALSLSYIKENDVGYT